MLQSALQSILTHFLTLGAGYLVAQGIWTGEEAKLYVMAASAAIIGFGWAQLTTYWERRKLTTAMATPGVKSENQIIHLAKTVEQRPPVTIDPARIPYPIGESRPMGAQDAGMPNAPVAASKHDDPPPAA